MLIQRGKMKYCVILLALALLSTSRMSYSQQQQKTSPKGTRFFIYTPPGYPGNGPYPVLVSLHGLWGVGTDLNLLLTGKDQIPAKLITENKWPSSYPFIVVTPQLKEDNSVSNPKDQEWPPEVIDEVLEYVKSTYAVNERKIYITGFSMGSHGSYSYAAAFPSKIAAVAIISGRPDSTIACKVKDIPIWAFHGSDDGQVWPVWPQGMVRAINECSPRGKFHPRLDLLYGRRHEGWDEIYNNSSGYNIYDWLLKFTKNDAANTKPYVNAGPDMRIAHRNQPIHLYGEYFDSDGSVTNARWTQTGGGSVTMADVNSGLLRLTGYAVGTYQFRLTVNDDNGAQHSDDVAIEIVSDGGGMAVTELTLMNATNGQTISALSDGYIVNPHQLKTNDINIRATVSGNPGSVRFRINANQNNRTSNNAPYLLADRRWTVERGEYLVCATPYSGKHGTGSKGTSQCFKIVVSNNATQPEEPVEPEEPEEPVDPEEPEKPEEPVEPEEPVDPEEPEEPVEPEQPEEPIEPEPEEPVEPEEPQQPEQPVATHFYAKPGSDISQLTAWSSNAAGTGMAPASFATGGQTFHVTTKVALNNPLAIGGNGSIFRIGTGGELGLNNSLTAPIHMDAQAVLHINTQHPVTFGTLHATSVVYFNANARAVPSAQYGHVYLIGNGSSKTLAPGLTRLAGNLTVDDGVIVNGSTAAVSILALSGNIVLNATNGFGPPQTFSMVFEKQGTQDFNLRAPRATFQEIVVKGTSVVKVTGGSGSTLELGSPSGGGLTVDTGGKFFVNRNHLVVGGNGTLNAGDQTGQVGFSNSSLHITSGTGSNFNLYTVPGADSIRNLVVNLTSAGNLNIQTPLYVVNSVELDAGITNSNGNLTLVSTATETARLPAADGTGVLKGDVVFQRFIPKGKQTRYLSFPVKSITVAELQATLPVTGNFSGSSAGEGLANSPSVFSLDERKGGWIPFPQQNNSEAFEIGRGYAVTIPHARDTKVIVSGPVHQGDFMYPLTPNTSNGADVGWTLIGNPYASPIAWNEEGWERQGVSTAAYVLDDSYPGGRYLVWNGVLGDAEFGGIITQGQGFLVRTAAATPLLTVTEAAKSDTSSRIWRVKRSEASTDHLVISLKQNDLVDRTYLKFSPEGDNALEESDAVKRRNGYFSLSSSSSDSVSLAINHLAESFCDRHIGLIVETTSPGTYTLVAEGPVFDGAGAQVNLVDNFTGNVIALHENPAYEFQVNADPASQGKSRFQINIPSGTLEDPVISVEEQVLRSNISSGNQWLLNGEEIEGATADTYLPQISGAYSLRVTLKGCSRTSAAINITVTVTGIYEHNNQNVIFYPNPASDFIRVRLDASPPRRMHYTITNAIGSQVANGEMEGNKMMDGAAIDVRKLPSGVYFLTLRATGWSVQKKFVVDQRSP
jgi:pimeloyl-ACP methyl ester carboxylesterase